MAGQTDSDFGKVLASQTQRKRAEDDLAKSEQDKIAILDSLREHVVYHDRKMRILWANKAACESAHMKREDLMGCYCYEVWAGRRSPCEDCPVIKARETGQLQMVEKMTPDGRWWYIQGHPVRDSNGQVVGTTELTLEITERRRAEEAVRKAKDELEIKVEERTVELIEAIEKLRREIDVRKRAEKDLHETKKLLSNTLNTLQDLVLVIDKDLRIIMSNWKDHDYIAEKDREGHPYCYEVFMDRKTPCNPCHAAEVFTTGEIKQLEVTNPIDGKFRDLRVLPMFDDEGKVVAVIEHLRNITDRKRAEKAQNESEFRYHELFDRISNGVAVYRAANDGEDFIFVDFNKAGERIDNFKRENIIGKSEKMNRVLARVTQAAESESSVYLEGESGTGKGLIAKALHFASPSKDGSFVSINCATIPENLLESELFGYEKGAFTGASHRRMGKIEQANGGTVFLDEIGDMPFSIQAKILRLLQEKSIERLGGRETIPVDVRIIAATNRDLETALAEGRFREDLYYRLKVVTISLPPLRERQDDILLLIEYFLSRYAEELDMSNPGITKEAIATLSSHPWPGNVRELANAIQKALIFNRGTPIHPEDIVQAISGESSVTATNGKSADQIIRQWVRQSIAASAEKNRFDTLMDHFASITIGEALNLTDGNRSRAAKLLGLSRPTLHSKIEKYGLKLKTTVDT